MINETTKKRIPLHGLTICNVPEAKVPYFHVNMVALDPMSVKQTLVFFAVQVVRKVLTYFPFITYRYIVERKQQRIC